MSDAPTPVPARPSRRLAWLLLAICVVILAIFLWFLFAPGDPGVRSEFVWPNTPAGIAMNAGGAITVGLSPALQADNVQAQPGGVERSMEQILFLRRETCRMSVQITAGAKPLNIGELRYILLDADNNEIETGKLRPAVTLNPNQQGEFTISDIALVNAKKIVINKAD